jgi:hypothetical protein
MEACAFWDRVHGDNQIVGCIEAESAGGFGGHGSIHWVGEGMNCRVIRAAGQAQRRHAKAKPSALGSPSDLSHVYPRTRQQCTSSLHSAPKQRRLTLQLIRVKKHL